MFRVALAALVAATALAPVASAASPDGPWRDARLDRPTHTRTWMLQYRSHTGRTRRAYLLLPTWYGPGNHPRIPLVISPHGRGTDGFANRKLWGDLPAIGSFGVVNPDGEGERLDAYSWGARGQIDDLARMPEILGRAFPWLRVDRRRIYAVGGSMGGQETLLLLAQHPRLLAGAAAFDPLVDFDHQYHQFPRLACSPACLRVLGAPLGSILQRLARAEVGGAPAEVPFAYAARSPLTYARAIAGSCVPLQLWWSLQDRIVVDPWAQSGRLLAQLRQLNAAAPVEGIVGRWVHSAEMRASARLPFALFRLGLLPPSFGGDWGLDGATLSPMPEPVCRPRASLFRPRAKRILGP